MKSYTTSYSFTAHWTFKTIFFTQLVSCPLNRQMLNILFFGDSKIRESLKIYCLGGRLGKWFFPVLFFSKPFSSFHLGYKNVFHGPCFIFSDNSFLNIKMFTEAPCWRRDPPSHQDCPEFTQQFLIDAFSRVKVVKQDDCISSHGL